jgi:hypothetical protein
LESVLDRLDVVGERIMSGGKRLTGSVPLR